MDRHSEPSTDSTPDGPATTRTRVIASSPRQFLKDVTTRLRRAEPCVVVARSRASALCLGSLLGAQRQPRVSLADPAAGTTATQVVIHDAGAPPADRRNALDTFCAARCRAIVVDPAALQDARVMSMLRAVSDAHWIVQDAGAAVLPSGSFHPESRTLLESLSTRPPRSIDLHVSPMEPEAARAVAALAGVEPVASDQPPGPRASVSIRCLVPDGPLEQRSTLAGVIARMNAGGPFGRAVFVVDSDDPGTASPVPPAELASVAEEVGFRVSATTDPHRTGTRYDGWLEHLTRPSSAVVTSDPEALHCIQDGPPVLACRFVPPLTPGKLLDECLRLSEAGGGTWAFAGRRPTRPTSRLTRDQVAAAGSLLVAACGKQAGPVPMSAEQIAESLGLHGPLEAIARSIQQVLAALVGAGLLRSARRVAFLLEVADAHRFQPPHIDIDPSYARLREKYDEAIGRMDLRQSVQYRLDARSPKDLRVIAKLSGYSVHELNTLFNDLSSEGIVPCRLSSSGSQGNIDFEVEGAGDEAAMASMLDQTVADAMAWLEQVHEGRWDLVERLAGQDASVAHLLETLEEEVRRTIDPEDLSWLVVQPGLTGADKPVSQAPSPPSPARQQDTKPDAGAPGSLPVSPAGPRRRAESLDSDENGHLDALQRFLDSSLGPESYAPSAWERLLQAVHGIPEAALSRAHALIDAATPEEAWPRAVARVVLLATRGDPNEAAQALEARLHARAPEVATPWIPALLNVVDHRIDGADGTPRGDLPTAVQRLALLLPGVEETEAQVSKAVDAVGFQGGFRLRSLGVLELEWEGGDIVLVRNNLDPDAEARLWLAVSQASPPAVPRYIITSRLVASYTMIAGIAESSLTGAIAREIANADDPSTAGAPVPYRLARARALVELDRAEEALDSIEGLADEDPGTAAELRRIRLEALIHKGDLLDALATLPQQSDAVAGTPSPRLTKALTSALQARCQAQDACTNCPLRESRFCPPASEFVAFLLENPLDESPADLVGRLNRRAKEGIPIGTPKQLVKIIDAFGNSVDEAPMEAWIESLPIDEPGVWVTLARKLLRHGRTGPAGRIAGRLTPSPDDHGTQWRLARLKLALGAMAEALDIAVRLETDGSGTWSPIRFCADLDAALGSGWESRVHELTADLNPEASALLQRLAEVSRARKSRAERRARLEVALERGSWRELKESLDAYLASDPSVERDRLVREANQRIERRKRRLEQRVRRLVAGERSTLSELERAARDTEALGLTEANQRVQEALAKRRSNEKSAQERQGRGSRRRDGVRQRRGSVAGEPGRGDRAGGPRRGQPPRKPSPASRFTNEVDLLAALKQADGDRTRVRMVMPEIERLMEEAPERGIKLLRNALAEFQYPDVMSRPLAKLVSRGKPPDEFLPRLKRLLQDYPGGRGFQDALSEISTRQHPEPWKQVLAQLKLKS